MLQRLIRDGSGWSETSQSTVTADLARAVVVTEVGALPRGMMFGGGTDGRGRCWWEWIGRRNGGRVGSGRRDAVADREVLGGTFSWRQHWGFGHAKGGSQPGGLSDLVRWSQIGERRHRDRRRGGCEQSGGRGWERCSKGGVEAEEMGLDRTGGATDGRHGVAHWGFTVRHGSVTWGGWLGPDSDVVGSDRAGSGWWRHLEGADDGEGDANDDEGRSGMDRSVDAQSGIWRRALGKMRWVPVNRDGENSHGFWERVLREGEGRCRGIGLDC